jgi:hypothetical protein
LTGESGKSLKTLDPPVKPGDDNIITLRIISKLVEIIIAKYIEIYIHNVVIRP